MITSSSTHSNSAVRNLADLTQPNLFSSYDQLNQWFSYDFHARRVIFTHYTIVSYECSSEGENWTDTDLRSRIFVLLRRRECSKSQAKIRVSFYLIPSNGPKVCRERLFMSDIVRGLFVTIETPEK
jgi:hypothetical protein